MALMRITDTARVPPGGHYTYIDPEIAARDPLAATIRHPYLLQVRLRAHSLRLANRLPIPTNWESYFEDNVCRSTPTCPCEPGDRGERTLWQMAMRFTSAMTTWAAAGFPLVNDTTLAARRMACQGGVDEGGATHARCPQWEAHTRYFGFGRCGKCGCSGGLKTALATERCPLGKWIT